MAQRGANYGCSIARSHLLSWKVRIYTAAQINRCTLCICSFGTHLQIPQKNIYYANQKKSDTYSNVCLVHLFEMNFVIQGLFSTERLNIQLAHHLNRLLRPCSGVWIHTERGGILGWGHSKSVMQTSTPSTVVGLSLDKARFFSNTSTRGFNRCAHVPIFDF